jgi:hypothetical protein
MTKLIYKVKNARRIINEYMTIRDKMIARMIEANPEVKNWTDKEIDKDIYENTNFMKG